MCLVFYAWVEFGYRGIESIEKFDNVSVYDYADYIIINKNGNHVNVVIKHDVNDIRCRRFRCNNLRFSGNDFPQLTCAKLLGLDLYC